MVESGLQPADPTALARDSRALGIARGSRAQSTRRSRSRAPLSRRNPDLRSPPRPRRRSGQHEARGALALALRAGAAPAAGPPGECGRGRAGGGGKPGLADPRMPAAARGGGGEPRTSLLPALAPGTVNPETRALFPVSSAVGGGRAARAAPGGGLGRPAERSLRPGLALNYVKRLHLRRSPPGSASARGRGSHPVTPGTATVGSPAGDLGGGSDRGHSARPQTRRARAPARWGAVQRARSPGSWGRGCAGRGRRAEAGPSCFPWLSERSRPSWQREVPGSWPQNTREQQEPNFWAGVVLPAEGRVSVLGTPGWASGPGGALPLPRPGFVLEPRGGKAGPLARPVEPGGKRDKRGARGRGRVWLGLQHPPLTRGGFPLKKDLADKEHPEGPPKVLSLPGRRR